MHSEHKKILSFSLVILLLFSFVALINYTQIVKPDLASADTVADITFDDANDFDVSDAGEIEVTTNGANTVAQLIGSAADISDNDNSVDGFGGAISTTNTQWDAGNDWFEHVSGTGQPFDDGSDNESWFNMESNTMLLHMDDASGNIDDSSSTNHDLTNNGATYGASGQIGDALSFNGTSSKYVNGINSSQLPADGGTVMFWFNASSAGSGQWQWMFSNINSTYGDRVYVFFKNDNNLTVAVENSTYVTLGTTYRDNKWHHVSLVYSQDESRVYIDGVAIAIDIPELNGDITFDANTYTGIGYLNNTTPNYYFNGSIDELAIFDDELNDHQIKQIYNMQNSGLSGRLESRIIDSGSDSKTWETFDWLPLGPYGKALPDNSIDETAYTNDNVTMSDNIALWHFDESNYSSGAADSSGGTQYDGTTVGAPIVKTNGKFGNAVYFDRNSGTDDYFNTGLNYRTALGGGDEYADSFTFEFWTKPYAVSTGGGSLGFFGGDNFRLSYGYVNANQGRWYYYWNGNHNATSGLVISPNNTWQHVAWVYSKEAQTLTTYFNGQSVWSNSYTGSTLLPDTDLWLGCTHNTTDCLNDFYGYIDDFAIYNAALDSTEILKHYKRGATNLKYQVRSCNDDACNGESFIGPDGTTDTYFSELNSDQVGDTPSADLTAAPISDNRYFQYQAIFSTENASYTTELDSVTIGPGTFSYPTTDISASETAPYVENNTNGTLIDFSNITGFSHVTLNDLDEDCDLVATCEWEYNVSNDGSTWYWWNGANWAAVTGGSNAETNNEEELDAHLSTFASEIGVGTFYLRAYGLSDGSVQPQLDSITLDIVEPYVTLDSDVVVPDEDNGETNQVTFTVNFVGGNSNGYTVQYDTADDTATAGEDYTAIVAGQLEWLAGDTASKEINVALTNDSKDENDEVFNVVLSNPSAGLIISANSGIGATAAATITDDDLLEPVISLGDKTANEPDLSPTATTLSATLDAQSGKEITVDYITVAGTATEGVDYVLSQGTLTFVADDISEDILVTLIPDQIDEDNETFTIQLSNPVNATLSGGGATLDATVTIQDDDGDVAGATLEESDDSTDVSEDGTTDTYSIVLLSQPTNDVTVTANADAGGQLLVNAFGDDPDSSATLTFTDANWNIAQDVYVSANDDELDETDVHTATITHTVSSGDSMYDNLAISDVTANITDNDALVVISIADVDFTELAEDSAATMTITAGSQGGREITVDYETSNGGTAALDSDYTAVASNTATFTVEDMAADNLEKTFEVPVLADDLEENNETVLVTLSNLVNAVFMGGGETLQATLTIHDDDESGVTLTEIDELEVQDDSTAVLEEGETSDYLKVVLTSEPYDDVTVTIADDSGQVLVNKEGEDPAAETVLTFTALDWSTEQIVTVTAVDDAVDEDDTHTATLVTTVASAGDANYDAYSLDDVTVSITDNDVTVVVEEVEEGGGGGSGDRGSASSSALENAINNSAQNSASDASGLGFSDNEVGGGSGSGSNGNNGGGVVSNEVFADISNHWAKDYIANLAKLNVVSGKKGGSFDPDGKMTRMEALKIVVLALTDHDIVNSDVKFTDVDSNHWGYEYLTYAYEKGLAKGYSDGSFKPDKFTNRAESLKLVMEAARDKLENVEISELINFGDVDISSWYYEYFLKAYNVLVGPNEERLVKGYSDGTARPENSITRAEFSKIVNLLLQY